MRILGTLYLIRNLISGGKSPNKTLHMEQKGRCFFDTGKFVVSTAINKFQLPLLSSELNRSAVKSLPQQVLNSFILET